MEEELVNDQSFNQEKRTDNITDNATNEQLNNSEVTADKENSDNMTAETELVELKDSYIRLMAEYENYRKRSTKEKAELIKNGGEKVLIGLLPILDDFERAVQNITDIAETSGVSEGIKLIYNKFISFLNQNGVKQIPAVNEPFNEELFDAVAIIPAANEEQKGKVIECVQTGYSLNDKIIRHAKVVVAE